MCESVHIYSWVLAVATRHSELLKIHPHMTALVPTVLKECIGEETEDGCKGRAGVEECSLKKMDEKRQVYNRRWSSAKRQKSKKHKIAGNLIVI